MLKDRYNQIWAMDSHGNPLWTFRGIPGHRTYPHDFTDDGRQELIGGYDILTPDGQRLWTADMAAHPDSIAVGDVDGNGAQDIVLGGAGLGGDSTNADRHDGNLLWCNLDAVEAQQVGLGDFRPDLPGLEVAGLDRVNRTTENGKDALYLVGATGELLWKEFRDSLGCRGSVMEPLQLHPLPRRGDPAAAQPGPRRLGHECATASRRAASQRRRPAVQRAEFTGLGRHVRLRAHGSRAPLRVAELTVFGTR